MQREKRLSLPLDGPATSDVYRLWSYIRAEFVPDARIVVTPFQDASDRPSLRIELVSEGVTDTEGHIYEDVWSQKEFHNPLHLISTNQLFDLLIVGQRLMDQFFMSGEAFAPTRRRK